VVRKQLPSEPRDIDPPPKRQIVHQLGKVRRTQLRPRFFVIKVPQQRDGIADLGEAELRDALSERNKTTFHHPQRAISQILSGALPVNSQPIAAPPCLPGVGAKQNIRSTDLPQAQMILASRPVTARARLPLKNETPRLEFNSGRSCQSCEKLQEILAKFEAF
jgi:hypothetical protein